MSTNNFCFYLQNRQIQASQTGGQWYNDTFPFSIPATGVRYGRKMFMKVTPGIGENPGFPEILGCLLTL
jgi:hypothetical protein